MPAGPPRTSPARPDANRGLRRRSPEPARIARQKRDARRAAGYLSAVEHIAPRSRPRNLPRRIDHRSRLFCIASASSGTRVQLFFRDACYDRISILDALLVDEPRSQPVAGKPRGDAVGNRVDVVGGQHVHDDAAVWRQPCADGVAGFDVEFPIKVKIRTADIDGDPIVKQIVIENEFPEIGHDQRQSVR